MSRDKEIFFKKDLPTVMENIAKAKQDWLDELLDWLDPIDISHHDFERLKPRAKAAIRAKLAEERIDELKKLMHFGSDTGAFRTGSRGIRKHEIKARIAELKPKGDK